MSSIYQEIAELETKNEAAVLCTIVRSQGSTPRRASSKMLVFADGRITGTIGGGEIEQRVKQEALVALEKGQPNYLEYNMAEPSRGDPGVCGGSVEVYVEPILPKPVLVVIGAGHVGKALVHLAHWLGFWVVVCDDRPEFCSPESVPGADAYYPVAMQELPANLVITPWTYLVLTTRGVDVDVEGLPVLLTSKAAYIGVIGSRRRWTTTWKQLLERGVNEAELERVHSPVGLELNAETPEEIAVSIMAEIIMLRNGGDGREMKKKGNLHPGMDKAGV
ncbi:MAG: XdhC family protein [Anaerolineales bacterium]|nr:XdhC family protein [Anaerolineales bacterium]